MFFDCNCDPNVVERDNRDIFVYNLNTKIYGKSTGRIFIRDLVEFQQRYGFDWGPVHHAKVLHSKDSRHSVTNVMFLRLCNPVFHDEVIKELDLQEWPPNGGYRIRLEFNKKATKPHHLKAKERYAQMDKATQCSMENINDEQISGFNAEYQINKSKK